MATTPKQQVVIIAVGGATCSGKTTLSKHLATILPNSTIFHQDDMAPPAEQVPMHAIHNVQDWDDPDGAILWPLQRQTLHHLRSTGTFPANHSSHDHLNEQIPVPVSHAIREEWKAKFEDLAKEKDVKYIIADGFLMLYDDECVRDFDVRLFVREDYGVLKKRREDRNGYHTAEGSLWRDPPDYWDNIVWPAYMKAHKHLFVDGNVEKGVPDEGKIDGLVVLEAGELGMEEMVKRSCVEIFKGLKSGRTCKDWKKP